MAEENIKIVKKVYGAKSASDSLDISFSEFSKSKKSEDVGKLFSLYNEIFYDIPKEGEQSLTRLIFQSTNFVRDFIDPKDETIDRLLERIIELEDELINVTESEHPIFRNGSFIRTPNGAIYFMQQGKARLIANEPTYITLATAQGLDPETDPFIEVASTTPSEIGIGITINSESDFSNFEAIVPTTTTTFISARRALTEVRVNNTQLAELKAIIEDKTVSDSAGILLEKSPVPDDVSGGRAVDFETGETTTVDFTKPPDSPTSPVPPPPPPGPAGLTRGGY